MPLRVFLCSRKRGGEGIASLKRLKVERWEILSIVGATQARGLRRAFAWLRLAWSLYGS
jgi:hypothetical protein